MNALNSCRLPWRDRTVEVEYRWTGPVVPTRPLLVFLHEGLGSVSLWKDFPDTVCAALGCVGLVYSRPGYGRSTPRAPDEKWGSDFMEQQACEVLPTLLQALQIPRTHPNYWMFGHSDGGSIALIHAARFPENVQGLVVVAPHVMVEDVSVHSIEAARKAYVEGSLRSGLAKHHQDPDSAFWGWNDVWLSPAFRTWSIEALLPAVTSPVLAIQGREDVYGSLAQIERIAELAPQVELKVLGNCGHSPHRDQPQALLQHTLAFFNHWQPKSHSPAR